MDYRELENRMERNRELIKQRAYDRLIEEAKKADAPKRTNWLALGRSFLAMLMRRKPKSEPQPQVQLKPAVKLKHL